MESKLYIEEDGTKVWKLNDGTIHKEGKPAMVYNGGIEIWYINGLMHREDGPAYDSESYKEWRINNQLHRENEPAIVDNILNNKEWWTNGNLHRENDKPAIINERFEFKEWWFNGKRHRENDKPAKIIDNYLSEWWFNGYLHRGNNNPAIINNKMGKEWWFNGKRHNSIGAAVKPKVNKRGVLSESKYYLEGKEYNYEDFKMRSRKYKLNILLNE